MKRYLLAHFFLSMVLILPLASAPAAAADQPELLKMYEVIKNARKLLAAAQ